jgi:mRNA interferase RelE/StbE
LTSTRYRVFLESKADRQLRKLAQEDRERVSARIQKLKEGLLPELDVKKLKGYKDQYRLRVGEFRVLFELQPEHTIVVYAVLPRKKAYHK